MAVDGAGRYTGAVEEDLQCDDSDFDLFFSVMTGSAGRVGCVTSGCC
jgi:hypothetical protein